MHRKYRIREDFFDSIDSEEKSYFLGLIYADGSVGYYNRSYITSISLIEEDGYILEKLSNLIYIDPRDLYERFRTVGKNQKTFSVISKKIFDSLGRHGCMPKKSLTLEFPTVLSDELMPHFIRGYFDGDGCFYFQNKKGSLRATWSVVGSVSFSLGLHQYLMKLDIKCKQRVKKKNGYVFIESRKGIRQVMELIYDSMQPDLYIRRKFDKYQEYKNLLGSKELFLEYLGKDRLKTTRKFSEADEQKLIKMYLDGMSSYQIGNILNIWGPTVIKILKRNNIKRREAGHHVKRDLRSGRFLGQCSS